jgi:hypothetical protein
MMGIFPAVDCKKPPRPRSRWQPSPSRCSCCKHDVDHVLEAPTGWGKTYAGVAVAMGLSQTTLIVVTKTDLMPQWRNTLINLAGVDPANIGIAQADKLDYKGRHFVLATVQSLIRPGKYDADFFRYFGFVIFDESAPHGGSGLLPGLLPHSLPGSGSGCRPPPSGWTARCRWWRPTSGPSCLVG